MYTCKLTPVWKQMGIRLFRLSYCCRFVEKIGHECDIRSYVWHICFWSIWVKLQNIWWADFIPNTNLCPQGPNRFYIIRFCYTLDFNLSLVILLHLACSVLMSCQLTLLVLSTFCVCKLWWKSVISIFSVIVIMVSLLYVHAKRTGLKIRPRPKTIILKIRNDSNDSKDGPVCNGHPNTGLPN